jgi:hypothetical protein
MMNRREALAKVALGLGALLSSSTLEAAQLAASGQKVITAGNFSLTTTQKAILAEVAEHIIPKTDTVGAKDTGCPEFIEMMINDCYYEKDQKSFTYGLKYLESKNFLAQNNAAQIETLKKLEADTKAIMDARNVKTIKVGDNVDKEAMDASSDGTPFWYLTKGLTLLGYYTSEGGINASFVYEPIPGTYKATKLKPGQKAYQYL